MLIHGPLTYRSVRPTPFDLPSIRSLDIWSSSTTTPQAQDAEGDCAKILADLAAGSRQAVSISSQQHVPILSPLEIECRQDWQDSLPPVLRRASLASACTSAPSMTHSLSGRSTPLASPRSPLCSFFVPLLEQDRKFHLSSEAQNHLAVHVAHYHEPQSWRPGPSSPQSQVQILPRTPSYARHLRAARNLSTGPRVRPRPCVSGGVNKRRQSSSDSLNHQRPATTKNSHINKEYSDEENYFIIYQKVDLKKSWRDIEVAFAQHFPESAGDARERSDDGLQSTYYRMNDHCPVVDSHGQLTYGVGDGYNKAGVRTCKRKVRSGGKISLITRYATEIAMANYSWILPEHMDHARYLAELRRPHWEAANHITITQGMAGLHLPARL